MKRNREKSGLTLIEILVVLAIIALMTGVLIPAVSMVKKAAKDVKQRAQFGTIDLALTTFKGDYGDYPPSVWPVGSDYCGAQKLAEALVGWDMLGFRSDSVWRSDGCDASGTVLLYDPADPPTAREGPYLEGDTTSAFKVGDLFSAAAIASGGLAADTYVLCDVYGGTKVSLPGGKTANAGSPLLYYKADTSGAAIAISDVYKVNDDDALVLIKDTEDGPGITHPLGDPAGGYANFYDYIRDPKITAKAWPYRPSSYILISAGADGIYGTDDDIRNFGD
ncbi:MAG: type II secretion system protein [Sedimentisphaerales bacterium]|nr:type II secretion system protein [Sedimentisphaerales bacterium]